MSKGAQYIRFHLILNKHCLANTDLIGNSLLTLMLYSYGSRLKVADIKVVNT